ncbi:VWA domain-containing protein [Leucobacter sp. cx-42]|uniref:VWA domain-containing protein n=1 Tax=unclassified Leucobacter TaxID=2621730 RepID=UPI00165D572C|nr:MULTISPECIES: VWA domain-containing protein [unclassified Leucobacter]MBC9954828.1 VWA domain-containing protein [Leucobacter sp. cx-42]
MSTTAAEPEAQFRARLTAAAALTGIPVDVTDGETWAVVDGRVYVGTAWFTQRGIPQEQAVPLALLLIWESVREARCARSRWHRTQSLAARRVELSPLLAGLIRALAIAELTAAFPAFRSQLARAVTILAPAQPLELPRHLQFVAACVQHIAGADFLPFAPEVADALAAVTNAAQQDLLRLAVDPMAGEIERLERALAITLPLYDRLLTRDVADRGLGQAGDAPSPPPTEDGGESGLESGASDGQGEAERETDSATGTAGDSEPARAGDRPEDAEGSDLFEAEQAGFVRTVLATPLPANGAWIDGVETPEIERAQHAEPSASEAPGGAGPAARLEISRANYRDRLSAQRDAVERVRRVWERIIAERVGMHRSLSRRAEAEGDLLDQNSLVSAVTEALSGVRRPRAFRSPETRPRRASRTGSTDYVLLIDRSASMQGATAEAAADAAIIVLEALAGVERDIAHTEAQLGIDLELSIRTSLLLFDAEPVVVKPLAGALDEGMRQRMFAEIRSPRGSTNDAAALRAAADELRLGEASAGGIARKRIVMVIGDGGTNDAGAAANEVRHLRSLGVTVLGVGIGSADLALRYAPDGHTVRRLEDLAPALEALVEAAGLTQ